MKKKSKVLYPLKIRVWEVKKVFFLTKNLKGLVFYVEDMQDFDSKGFDDHIRFCFISDEQDPIALIKKSEDPSFGYDFPHNFRVYTIYSLNKEKKEVVIYVYLHEHGLASDWARNAQVGDRILTYGPRASILINNEAFSHFIMLGDETAMPAIFRRVNELAPNSQKTMQIIVEIKDEADQIQSEYPNVQIDYILKEDNNEGLIKATKKIKDISADTHIWIAMESELAKSLSQYFRTEHSVHKDNIFAMGYWDRD